MPARTLLHPEGYPEADQDIGAYKSKYWISRSITYIILGIWVLFTFYALSWMALASVKSNREIFSRQFLPAAVHLENYLKALTTLHFGRYFLNSLLYVGGAMAILTAISAPAAYVLSRVNFPGRKQLTNLFIAGIGIPTPLLFIPIFTLFLRLHMAKTVYGLIITYVSVSIPFHVYYLSAFFASLPKEMEEAAIIDGCSYYQTYWRVMLPLAQPGIITITIFRFIFLWNEYTWALIFVNTPQLRSLALGLYGLKGAMQYSGDWAGLYAGVMLVVIPTILLYIFLSERIISGITMGGLK